MVRRSAYDHSLVECLSTPDWPPPAFPKKENHGHINFRFRREDTSD